MTPPTNRLRSFWARQHVALRMARRSSIRSIGRSALIVVMVSLPAAGLAAVGVVGESMNPSTPELIATSLGQNEARLQIVSAPDSSLVQSPTEPEWWEWGHDAQGKPTHQAEGAVPLDPHELFPAGTRILPIFRTSVTATTERGIASFEAVEGPAWDPAFKGLFTIIEGRAPRSDHEVMVTAATLPRLGASIGDSVTLHDAATASVTIVGIIGHETVPDTGQYFFGRAGAFSGTMPSERLEQTEFYLPDTALDWAAVQELNHQGATVLSRDVLNKPPPPDAVELSSTSVNPLLPLLGTSGLIAGFAAFTVVLLSSAAFTVTARQQQRLLATLASVGATRPVLRRVLTSMGLVLGAAGGLLGMALGVTGGGVYIALTGDGSSTRYYGFHIPWLLMAGIVVLSVIIGWLSSLVSARKAARFDVVAALRGARRPPKLTVRRPVVGLVILGVGIAACLTGGALLPLFEPDDTGMLHPFWWLPLLVLVVGALMAQLGVLLCGQLILRGVARAFQHGGAGARLAARDAARNPGRSVPALAVILTTVFLAVVGMNFIASSVQGLKQSYNYRVMPGEAEVSLQDGRGAHVRVDDLDALVREIGETLDVTDVRVLESVPEPAEEFADDGSPVPLENPDALIPRPVVPPANWCKFISGNRVIPVASGECNAFSYYVQTVGLRDQIWVGDVDDLAMILGRSPGGASERLLADGGIVSFQPDYVLDEHLTIAWWSAQQFRDRAFFSDDARPQESVTLPAVLDKPESPIYFGVFMTKKTADRLGLNYEPTLILSSLATMPNDNEEDAFHTVARAYGAEISTISRDATAFAIPTIWGLLGLSLAITIAAAAVAIGLARFDGRNDDATLRAVGASPVVQRSFAFWQALILCGVGAVLGGGLGLVPSFALRSLTMPLTPPWLQIGLAVVALPLVIACGSWLLATRSKVSARRVAIA